MLLTVYFFFLGIFALAHIIRQVFLLFSFMLTTTTVLRPIFHDNLCEPVAENDSPVDGVSVCCLASNGTNLYGMMMYGG